jgi:hypothetical protein
MLSQEVFHGGTQHRSGMLPGPILNLVDLKVKTLCSSMPQFLNKFFNKVH